MLSFSYWLQFCPGEGIGVLLPPLNFSRATQLHLHAATVVVGMSNDTCSIWTSTSASQSSCFLVFDDLNLATAGGGVKKPLRQPPLQRKGQFQRETERAADFLEPPKTRRIKSSSKWLKSDFRGLPQNNPKSDPERNFLSRNVTQKWLFRVRKLLSGWLLGLLWGRPRKSLFSHFWATFTFSGLQGF